MISSENLIGRDPELQHVHLTQNRMRDGKPTNPVMYISGVPGSGRTAFLNEVKRMSAAGGIPFSLVDGGAENGFAGDEGQVKLMADVMKGWIHAADAPAAHPIHLGRDNPDLAAAKVVEYTEWLQGFYKKPLALLIDNIDRMSSDTLKWFQESVWGKTKSVGPPAGTMPSDFNRQRLGELSYHWFQTFLVLAGSLPLDQTYREQAFPAEFTAQAKDFRLRPLNPEETNTQLTERKYGVMDDRYSLNSLDLERLMAITNGIPGINLVAARLMNSNEEMVTARAVVDNYLVKKTNLESTEAVELLPVLAALERFDLPQLGKIAAAILKDRSPRPDDRKAITHKLLNPLTHSGLVGSDKSHYGNAVVPEIRPILDKSRREAGNDLHMSTMGLILQELQEEIEKNPLSLLAVDEAKYLALQIETDAKTSTPSP